MRLPRDRQEVVILAGAVIALGLVWGFLALADEIADGSTRLIDGRILSWLRHPDDPAVLRGPTWLRIAALDITALGSSSVLGLTVLAVAGYLMLHGLYRYAVFIVVASVGGWWLQWGLKLVFDRARPDEVPHLQQVLSTSFPSGHALTSATVYLTLGALLMRIAEGPLAKYYCIATAMVVTALVGGSRVVLGVHYPTDVIGGWLMGMSWALLCWTIERFLEHRAGLRKEHGSS